MRDEQYGANVPHCSKTTQIPPELDHFGRRFTPVPVAAATDDRLNTLTHQIITYVSAESGEKGWCTKTQLEIGRALKHHRNTISRALQKLARWGYLSVAHGAYDPETHRKYRNAYRIQEPPTTAPAPTEG